MLWPGRAMLSTNPSVTRSLPAATIGIECVARCAASAAAGPYATMTLGFSRTSASANSENRPASPSASRKIEANILSVDIAERRQLVAE